MKKLQMPKVVSNTTPILALLKLNRLSLLRQLYTEIYVPTAVFNEIEAGKSKDYYEDLSKLDWVNIIEIGNKDGNSFPDLDKGEAEAIALALEMKADSILLDEKLGRFHAKNANLKVTGSIGILIRAKKEGLVNTLKPLLDELTDKKVWVSDKLKKEILKIAGEGQ